MKKDPNQNNYGFISECKYPNLEDFLNDSLFGGKVSARKRLWQKLIAAGKLTCPITNLKVSYFSHDRKEFKNRKGCSYHYNFYSSCGKLMTVDHIYPISEGGSKTDIDNLQAMEANANWSKGSNIGKKWGNS